MQHFVIEPEAVGGTTSDTIDRSVWPPLFKPRFPASSLTR